MQVSTLSNSIVPPPLKKVFDICPLNASFNTFLYHNTWGIGIGIYQKIFGFLFTNICSFLWICIYLFILLFEIFSISKNNIIHAEAAKVLQ
jgi:hypothetical protein